MKLAETRFELLTGAWTAASLRLFQNARLSSWSGTNYSSGSSARFKKSAGLQNASALVRAQPKKIVVAVTMKPAAAATAHSSTRLSSGSSVITLMEIVGWMRGEIHEARACCVEQTQRRTAEMQCRDVDIGVGGDVEHRA